MKLLLTSGGVTNPSIHAALVELLGKPVEESHALVVPTAQWGHPMCGPPSVRGLVAAAAMGGTLWFLDDRFGDTFAESTAERFVGVAILVGVGGIVYFVVAWIIGAVNKRDVKALLRRAEPLA